MNRRADNWGFGFKHLNKSVQLCFECGTETNGRHHVVPVSLGGTKQLPLCLDCHNVIHGGLMLSELVKTGLEKARLKGVKLGAPTKLTPTIVDRIRALKGQGLSYRAISKELKLSIGIISKVMVTSELPRPHER